MRVWPALCLTLVTLPCLGDPTVPPAQSAPPATPPAPGATADNRTPENVRTITIDPNARPVVCRRVVPTGSRIAEQRCESPKRTTDADEANREILRRDIQALRDQQLARDQARQAAMAEALRRRAQGQ